MFIIVFVVAPPLYCRALFYKKCLSDKVLLSLAVLQDLPSFKEVCAYGTYNHVYIMLLAISRRFCYPRSSWYFKYKLPFHFLQMERSSLKSY